MRMMLKIQIPNDGGNDGIKSGRLPNVLEKVTGWLKPEAAYFLPYEGKRTAFMFFDLKDPSDVPAFLEPILLELNGSVELSPVMNQAELQAGLGRLKR